MAARRASLGSLIRAGRIAAGLSAEKAARRLGVARRTWLRWEEGKSSIPVELLPSIAEVVGGCAIQLVTHVTQLPRAA